MQLAREVFADQPAGIGADQSIARSGPKGERK